MSTEAPEQTTSPNPMDAIRAEVAALPHDDLTGPLTTNILSGLETVYNANEVLLSEEDSETGVRAIDKDLRENYTPKFEKNDEGKEVQTNKEALAEQDKDIVSAVAKMEKARAAFKAAQDAARNLYRTNVLGEEEKTESDSEVNKEEVQQTRKMVQEAVGLLRTYALSNGKKDFVRWADSLEIPQVGRKGSSTVGQKKPRAYVSVNGEVTNSFGEAAKKIAEKKNEGVDKKNHVTVTSGDLTSAWIAAGETETFEYDGFTVTVKEKEKTSTSK